MDRRRPTRQATPYLVTAILACAGACASVSGQVSYYGAGDSTGKDFGGIRLPDAVRRGDVVIHASRAWVWAEGGTAGSRVLGPDGLPLGTQRLFLQGDVVVDLDGYHFTSAQAVVWSQNLSGPAAGDQDRAERQVAVYFDRVADPGAQAGYAQAADRLLVTAHLDGVFTLNADTLNPSRPTGTTQTPFLTEAEQRWQHYLHELSGKPEPTPAPTPTLAPGVISGQIVPGLSRPYEPNSPITHQTQASVAPELPIEQRTEPLFAKDGIVTFAVGTRAPDSPVAPDFGEAAPDNNYIRIVRGQEDNSILMTGGVAVQYTDLRKTRNLLIQAERAVVFLPPGPLTDLTRFDASQIRGMYLEGDVVATDGQYTLRGPRIYYDFQQNKAVMVDAVFSTVEPKLGVPVYVRAKAIRQEAANQFRAEGARLSTSSFFTPVFSVGAKSITVTDTTKKTAEGRQAVYVDAQSLTFRAGDVPFFWLPGFKGEVDNIPLQDIRVESSSGSGAALKTTWNAFGLFGQKSPDGVRARLLLDEYFDRGFAIGTRTDWNKTDLVGQVFAYGLLRDSGRDSLSNGVKIDRNDEFRGIALAENLWNITPNWSLQAEFSKISDPAFVDAFFRDLGAEGREVATSLYLKYAGGNSYFSALLKEDLNEFSPNQYLIETRGLTVNKTPEIRYARVADDVLGGIQPGLLTWTHEYSYARPNFNFFEVTPSAYGFFNDSVALREFGTHSNQTFANALRAQGFTQNAVNRVDTRQELSGVFDMSVFRINPFVVGRFTGYDDKIGEFYTASPDADKQYRGWWAGGVRVSTEVERIDDSVESSFFDLHRIRHIVTPSATVWSAASTIREESLPTYDDTVEALSTGTAVRAGVSNVWQTQRGGPGRWHSVDVFKLNTDFTFATADRNTRSPFGHFFDDRPEYSALGNFFTADAAWQVTDAVGLIFNEIYDFDVNQSARTVAGGIIQHNPQFSTYAQVRFLNPMDATYVDAGASYQLTRLYSTTVSLTYDTNRNEVQDISGTVRRRFQDASMGFRVNYNRIADETSFGFIFEPNAAAARSADLQRVGRLREIGR